MISSLALNATSYKTVREAVRANTPTKSSNTQNSKNNTAKITSTYNQLKSSTPKVTNKQIGTYFGSVGAAALSEKYLQKAITEDKDNSAKLILGQVYAGQGRKEEAIKILQEAVNNKVSGAAEVLKQVQAMKK